MFAELHGLLQLDCDYAGYSPIRSVVMTQCDFCLRPVAAQSLEGLVNVLNELGFKMSDANEVICENCQFKKSLDKVASDG